VRAPANPPAATLRRSPHELSSTNSHTELYNLMNNNVTLAFNQAYSATSTGWLTPTTYINPRVVRLNAEFSF